MGTALCRVLPTSPATSVLPSVLGVNINNATVTIIVRPPLQTADNYTTTLSTLDGTVVATNVSSGNIAALPISVGGQTLNLNITISLSDGTQLTTSTPIPVTVPGNLTGSGAAPGLPMAPMINSYTISGKQASVTVTPMGSPPIGSEVIVLAVPLSGGAPITGMTHFRIQPSCCRTLQQARPTLLQPSKMATEPASPPTQSWYQSRQHRAHPACSPHPPARKSTSRSPHQLMGAHLRQ